MGIAAPFDEEDDIDDDPPAAGVGPAPIMDVGVGTPDVRALMLALEAPAKATDWVEAAGLGAAEVLLGFKTLWAKSVKRVRNNEREDRRACR